ncbi:HD domain-containing phosphohydrolase [Methylomicrobium lacus]|uniref:HD domain-containing phosphohydrolase n=1 Tax=Methylomicrobium lacus TaxID=136992 RepID=UPI00045E63B3|nr:HD domain-containing phosphohydrolase [Methylomicrobium lacus]
MKLDALNSNPIAILICADPNASLNFQQALLASSPHCTVKWLEDPRQIVPALLQDHYALVLIDIDGSRIDGEDLVRAIRAHFAPVELPVLISHGPLSLDKRNAALAAGANDWLSNPIDTTEAMLRINNCLTLGTLYRSNKAIQNKLEDEIKTRTAKLDMLIDSGLMMSMEKSRSKLLKHILVEGQRLLNCDGGTMYLVTEENTLRFAERTRDDHLPFEEIALYDKATGQPNEMYASTYAALHNQTVIIDDVHQKTRFDCSGTRKFDALTGYHTVSLLTVPMAPRGGKVIGILQFFNAKDSSTGKIMSFPPDIIDLVGALAAQAAVALDNLQLVQNQKDTTENIIRIMAEALDSKSPHTGHHCVRVPELAFMLAEAACKETHGPLADFNFASEDEWFEFRVGAWLHDCGKVTTPEYVIEKATKLDTIHNRIHEIRTRFEVLLRDAEIACLQARLRGQDETAVNATFEQRKAELMDDFAFIAACNLGKEAMHPADIERIETIAQTKWLRHFDDRLGLSRDELHRRQGETQTPLPVEEFLLSDKACHVIPRKTQQKPRAELGIKMTVPENLYNYGELYNLSVQKGTLTLEDRYKINEHIIETIKMLEQLPFPDTLKRVPEYATTHHETLDGQGYPRRLSASDLSIPARIMAIADIFEALTSADRPYKQPYKLSKSLKILHDMKLKRHIDPDLFDLFLTSGTYRKFAELFLEPGQIDDVDISAFLSSASH